MSYKVLARKFRPADFDQVIGQGAVVRTLKNAITGERLAHAYLFSGARGVGKTTLARILAKSLNCHRSSSPTVTPCSECDSCREIAESASLDVQEIDGASNRGIDDIRELRETSRYQPSRDRYRVFIIDEVHMLTREAFNALLKTLEEPPPHVVFVFATTEHQKVPATITSRCQHHEFRRIERAVLARALKTVAATEAAELSDRGAELLARAASGSLRDALGYLDQAIAYCGKKIGEAELREVLGVVGSESVDACFQGLAARDAASLLLLIDQIARGGQDPVHFCRELVERNRELLLLRSTGEAAAILGMSSAEAAAGRTLAEAFSTEDLIRTGAALNDLEGRMRFSSNPRFLLEMTLLKLAATAPVVPIGELITRVEALATGVTVEAEPRSAPRPASAPPAPPRPPAAPATSSGPPPRSAEGGEPSTAVPADSKEEEIRRRIASKRAALASYLEHATTFRLDGDRLVIGFPVRHALFKNGLSRADNRAIVETACLEATGHAVKLEVGIAEDPDPQMDRLQTEDARASRQNELMSKAMEQPIVRAVMDTFRASVVRIEEAEES
jgi:DNA polymerase-3 subunit gamma/tau